MALAGTTAPSSARHKGSARITLEVSLRPGESYELPLTGRGSAGFSWSLELTGDRAAIEAHVEGLRGDAPASGRKPVVGSVNEQLVIKGLMPGKVIVHLAQRRSWEKNKPALAEKSVTVTVRAS